MFDVCYKTSQQWLSNIKLPCLVFVCVRRTLWRHCVQNFNKNRKKKMGIEYMQHFRRNKHNVLLCVYVASLLVEYSTWVSHWHPQKGFMWILTAKQISLSLGGVLGWSVGSSASTNWAGSFKESLESLDIDWILTCDHSGVLLVEPNILGATKYLIQMHRMSQGLNICLAFRSRWRIFITSHCERLSAKLWMPFLRDWK